VLSCSCAPSRVIVAASLSTWVFSVAHYFLIDELRRKRLAIAPLSNAERVVDDRAVPHGSQRHRAQVELVGMPSFSFQDSLVVTSPTVRLEAVPGGRLHATVRTDDAAGEGEVMLWPGQAGSGS
jgi:hypothetical protein